MTATREKPGATVPPPPGAKEPLAAPRPEACWACRGTATVPACKRCDGAGVEWARFDLAPSRSCELRRVRFEPTGRGQGRLFIGIAGTKWREIKWSEYTVRETGNDWGGRSFFVVKLGTDRAHNVFLGKCVGCECEGHTYLSAAKRNQAAHECGEPVFPSHGCLHTDALDALRRGGWFDL